MCQVSAAATTATIKAANRNQPQRPGDEPPPTQIAVLGLGWKHAGYPCRCPRGKGRNVLVADRVIFFPVDEVSYGRLT